MDKLYFEELGSDVSECKNLHEVLLKSGLDYSVEKQNIFLEDKTLIKDKYATVRSSDKFVYGIVGKDYCILNNTEGFDFVQELVETYNMKYIRAGHWEKENNSFIIISMPEIILSKLTITPYIFISNNYSGNGSITATLTPVIDKSVVMFGDYRIHIRHSKNAKDNLLLCQQLYSQYSILLENLVKTIEKYLSRDFTMKHTITIIRKLLELDKPMTNIKRERAEATVDEIMERYNSIQLDECLMKSILAISQYECQRETLRETNNSEIFLGRILSGLTLLNKFIKEIK